MAYRTVILKSGDTVRIAESVLKGAGPEGPDGPPGPPGTATTIRGSVPTEGDLPLDPYQGDSYVVEATGHLWTWDMLLEEPAWVDAGRIVGPHGVTSIGASRTSAEPQAILGNGVTKALAFDTFAYNDPDPLATGNADPAFGAVLDESGSTATGTRVWPADDTHHMVLTTLSFAASAAAHPEVEVWWQDDLGAKTGLTTLNLTEVSIGGSAQPFHASYSTTIKTSSARLWTLYARASHGLTVTAMEAVWTRIGGGSGPIGPVGPPPELVVGSVGKVGPESSPTFTLTEISPGVYRVDVALTQGQQGVAGSGYDVFDEITSAADSTADPSDDGGRAVTDQDIVIPAGTSAAAIPWYFEQLVNSLYRSLVGRLDAAGVSTRGAADGEVVYDTTGKQLLLGVQQPATGPQHYVVPTVQWGTDAAVVDGAATERPDGSIYFKI